MGLGSNGGRGKRYKFLAPTLNIPTVTMKTETRRSTMQAAKRLLPGSHGDPPAVAAARPSGNEPPAMDALEAALKYRGFYICTTRKRA